MLGKGRDTHGRTDMSLPRDIQETRTCKVVQGSTFLSRVSDAARVL